MRRDFAGDRAIIGADKSPTVGKETEALVVYLDLAFFLNSAADALALYVTARLAGLPVRRLRLLGTAVLGGLYGALCLLPALAPAAGLLPQAAVAALLVLLAFGRRGPFPRQYLLFYLLSCTLGGALTAMSRLLSENGAFGILGQLDWKVFFLVSVSCYILLSLGFRGGARHALAGELRTCRLRRGDRRAELTALLDTGHTLTDPATGRPVLVADPEALGPLWTAAETAVLGELANRGPAWCLERLGEVSPGTFRLLPYQAVGVSGGLLLCCRCDGGTVGGEDVGPVTVALSPTTLAGGGGYSALWGGGKGERCHAA